MNETDESIKQWRFIGLMISILLVSLFLRLAAPPLCSASSKRRQRLDYPPSSEIYNTLGMILRKRKDCSWGAIREKAARLRDTSKKWDKRTSTASPRDLRFVIMTRILSWFAGVTFRSHGKRGVNEEQEFKKKKKLNKTAKKNIKKDSAPAKSLKRKIQSKSPFQKYYRHVGGDDA